MKYMPSDSPDEFEKQLGSLSLVEPSDEFNALATNMVENKTARQVADRSLWLGYAVAMSISVLAVTGLSFFLLDDGSPDNDLVLVEETLPIVASSSPELLYTSGIHYEELGTQSVAGIENDANINVFFSYPCLPCFEFEKVIEQWAGEGTSQLEVAYVPAIWSDEMRHYAQVFYAAQSLGIAQSSHQFLFEAIHQDELALTELPILARMFELFGVSEQQFLSAYESELTLSRVRQAEQVNQDYGIRSVPSLIVVCRYYITVNTNVEQPDMLPIAEYLVTNQDQGNQTRC
ncbi:MAG: thiol:disulfide interchange protein DsbA/DsbL [Pseudohongiellaceae bacterium]